jgi:MSHA biogenesis protein MshE
MARPEKNRLGEILVKQNLLTEEQLRLALDLQKTSGQKLGRVLVASRYATEEIVSRALARQLHIPFISLKTFDPDVRIVQKLPEAQARRFRAIVLEDLDDRYRVGMVDPSDLAAYDELGRLLKREIDLCIVTEAEFVAAVDRLYRRTGEITGLAKELTAELGAMPVEFGEILGLTTGQEDAPVVKLLQTVFEEALKLRASDIHVEPQDKLLRIRFRIDGVLHLQTEADMKIAGAVALRLKIISGLDISEKRLPQDGRFQFSVGKTAVDVRISTMPTQYGESVVMRLLNQATGLLGLDRLGMPPALLDRLRRTIHRPSGMVLVTGPTGSGKTTTLYAALSEINSEERKIITVEDPVEYRLPMINQVQVHEKIELGFERVLRSALRQDPDVILVGEMRDEVTAEIGMRAAITGHMVLSTLHTNDAISTPIRLLDMGVPRYMVALSLQLVLAQRLVRVICPHCKEAYRPVERYAGITLPETLYRGRGCDSCFGMGTLGRTAIYEIMPIDQELCSMIIRRSHAGEIKEYAVSRGMRTLRDDGLARAAAGVTTIEEVLRVTQDDYADVPL